MKRKVHVLAGLIILLIVTIFVFNTQQKINVQEEVYTHKQSHLSPYAIFGDSTEVLKTEFEAEGRFELEVINSNENDPVSKIIFDMKSNIATLYDSEGSVLSSIELNTEEYAIFLSVDRYSDKYPSLSPYHYTKNNPINFIDINGDSTWVTQTNNSITINTTIEFSGIALYKKNGEMRKGAQARIDAIKSDIIGKWDGVEHEGKEVNINLITTSSAEGGTNKSYDQIEVKRGGGRSYINISDANGNLVGLGKPANDLIRSIVKGEGDYNVSGTFYTNTQSGTYAHEYGHMIGYFSEDYKYENGKRVPSKFYSGVKNSIMYSTFGKPNSFIINHVMGLHNSN